MRAINPRSSNIAINITRTMGEMKKRELGRLSGLGKKRISQILAGRGGVMLEELESIAVALGCRVSHLVIAPGEQWLSERLSSQNATRPDVSV